MVLRHFALFLLKIGLLITSKQKLFNAFTGKVFSSINLELSVSKPVVSNPITDLRTTVLGDQQVPKFNAVI